MVEVKGDSLIRNNTQSCGCLHREKMHEIVFKDLSGKKFGKLTPINYFIKNYKTMWYCKCDCGNETIV